MSNNKEIQIRCRGSRELPYDKLRTFQGNLKEMTAENCRKLKSSILKYGWCAPVFVWGEDYILDGHGRLLVLAELLKEGYSIGPLPVVDIQADTKKQAGEILLAINSKYQTITDQGLHGFMSEMGIEIKEVAEFFVADIDLYEFDRKHYKSGAFNKGQMGKSFNTHAKPDTDTDTDTDADTIPLTFILSGAEWEQWQNRKSLLKTKDDKKCLMELLKGVGG